MIDRQQLFGTVHAYAQAGVVDALPDLTPSKQDELNRIENA